MQKIERERKKMRKKPNIQFAGEWPVAVTAITHCCVHKVYVQQSFIHNTHTDTSESGGVQGRHLL